jgi:predicted ATPase/class 3 adenylate cyclase
MKCPRCSFNNPEGMKFCGQCGASLVGAAEQSTDLIQSTLPEAMRSKILAAKVEGERRNVTVLFADVSGYTTLSEKTDPEEVRELINDLFKVLIQIIYKYEGTIDKFIGDCIMVLFGAPIAHEDDPERAVYAALEIVDTLKKFNEKEKTNLFVHIAINSGVVVVGGVGSDMRMDFTVIGDTVNLASRLLKLAKNDEILVSASVFKNTRYVFEIEKLKSVVVKGKAEKVTPYRVVGMKKTPQRKRGIAELSSPLVGRIKEFGLIRSVVERISGNKAEVISLIGEAGLGKSRIIEEVRRETDGTVVWIGGKCFSYGKTVPFSVFLDQLRSYCGIDELDSGSVVRGKLRQQVQSFLKEKTDKYFTYLCLFLSVEVPEEQKDRVRHLDPKSLRLEMYVSIKVFLKEMTKVKPIVLYFEDMHWIDPESLDLILFLLDTLKDESIIFLFETRPEKETGFYKIRQAVQMMYKNRYTDIRVPPLIANDVTTLVQNLLNISDFPKTLLSLIIEKSEGNPFYIEEIIRSLIDQGMLARSGESWQFISDVLMFEVPDTVEAVIRSRIDRLSHMPKEVLGCASVIGRNFPYSILFCTIKMKESKKAIEMLDRAEFIMNIDEPEPMFRHILIRDVVYNGLLKKRRREIHMKTAECIEKIFKKKMEDYYEILAYHYYNAEIYDKSYEYYQKAADRAKGLYRNDVAIKCYTRAIEVYTKIYSDADREHMAELHEKRGDVRELKAEYDDALKDYECTFDYYKNIEKRADIKRKIGKIFFQKGEYTSAVSFYEEAIKIFNHTPISPILSEILIDYATVISEGKGDYRRSERMIEEAFRKLDKKKEPEIYAHGLRILGNIAFRKNDYDEALKHYKKTKSILMELNDKKGIGSVYNNLGNVYYSKGELDTALEYYSRGHTTSKEIGHTIGIALALSNIGLVYRNKRKFDIALEYYKRCLVVAEEVGYKNLIGMAFNNIGTIYNASGDFDAALEYCKKYLVISEEIGDNNGICRACLNIGVVYYRKGEFNTALDYYKRSLTISEENDFRNNIGYVCLNIGVVYKEYGKLKQAKDYYEKAEKILQETGYRIGLLEVYVELSELNFLQKNYKDAQEYAESAMALAKKLGVRGYEISAVRTMGMVLSKENSEKAIDYIKQSIALAEKENATWELAICYYELAKILVSIKRIDEVKEYISIAKGIFQKLLAKAWLKKAESIEIEMQKLDTHM